MDMDQHAFVLKAHALQLSALLLVAAGATAAEPTFRDKAGAPWRPAAAPRVSDVVMRSLRPHPAAAGDPYDSIQAAQAFHATRQRLVQRSNLSAIDDGDWVVLSGISAAPWSVIVIE